MFSYNFPVIFIILMLHGFNQSNFFHVQERFDRLKFLHFNGSIFLHNYFRVSLHVLLERLLDDKVEGNQYWRNLWVNDSSMQFIKYFLQKTWMNSPQIAWSFWLYLLIRNSCLRRICLYIQHIANGNFTSFKPFYFFFFC